MKKQSYFVSLAMALAMLYPVLDANAYSLEEGRQHERAGMEAFQNQDFETAIQQFQMALEARPNHPGYLFNLAYLSATNDNPEQALHYLADYAALGLATNLDRELFDGLRESANYKAVAEKIAANAAPQGESELFFETNEPIPIAESIAFDATRDRFFISSVNGRKIMAVTPDGIIETFVDAASNGLFGVFGLRIDVERDLLWVASSALPQMDGFSDAQNGTAGIFAFSLADGNLVQKSILSPSDEARQTIGDLLILDNHEILATNSLNNIIFHFSPDGMLLSEYEIAGAGSLQGLVMSDDESKIIVADYSTGLYLFDRENGESRMLDTPSNHTFIGFDGLSRVDNHLVAVQNGTNPNRVVQIDLSPDWEQIEGVNILLSNHPDFEEPTSGMIHKDRFLVIANSQWPKFGNMENVNEETYQLLNNIKVLSINIKN